MLRRLMRVLLPVLVVGGGVVAPIGLQTASASTGTAPSTLTLSGPATMVQGNEQGASFQVQFQLPLSAGGIAVLTTPPTGVINVEGPSSQAICSIPLPTSLSGYALNLTATASGTATFTGTCSPTSGSVLTASSSPYALTASYAGDTSWAAETSNSLSTTVVAESFSVTATPSTVQVGQENQLNLAAQVGTSGPGITPSGTVAFYLGTSEAGTQLVCEGAGANVTVGANGVASCVAPLSVSQLTGSAAGTKYTIYAAYSGGGQLYAAADTAKFKVTTAADTVNLGVSPASVTYGNEGQVDLSADVTTTGAGTPTGSVTFYEVPTGSAAAPKAICSGVGLGGTNGTTANCDGQLGSTQLQPGAYTLSAVYSGDGVFPTATGTNALTVNSASDTVSLSFSPPSTTYGQEANEVVTATVTSGSGAPAPAGYVTISYGSWTCNTGSLTSTSTSATVSTATCTVPTGTTLPAGTDTVDASYTSSDGIYPNTKGSGVIVVSPAQTTTALQVSPDTVTYGQEHLVAYTATVTGGPGLGVPTGAVRIENADSHATVCITGNLVKATADSATATCQSADTTLAVGSYPHLVADYPQTGNYAASLSPDQSLTVNAATPTVALQWSTGTTLGGDLAYSNEGATTLTATVTGASGVGAYPGGAVDVYAVNTATGQKTLVCHTTFASFSSTSSTWTCSPAATALSAGTYDVWAAYSGDNHYAMGSSAQQALTVDPAVTTTVVSAANPNPVTYGAENTEQLGATVTNQTGSQAGATGTATQPTGTVSFYYAPGTNQKDWTLVCTTGPLSGPNANTSSASCSPSNPMALGAGMYTAEDLVAVYAPNGNFAGSDSQVTVSAPNLLQVKAAATSTKITATPGSVAYGSEQTEVFSIGVSTPTGNLATPTGSVEVLASGNGMTNVVLCPPTALASGMATCSPSNPTVLSGASGYTITAEYLGSTDFGSSTGTTRLDVTPAATSTSLAVSNPTGANPSVAFGTEATSLAFTVTVTGPKGGPAPLGTVTVYSDGNPASPHGQVCTGTLTAGAGSSSTATCIPSDNGALDAGSYTSQDLYAVYTPANSANDGTSSSYQSTVGTLLTVTSAATSTTVTVVSPTPPYAAVNPPMVDFGAESHVAFAVSISTSDAFLAPWLGQVTLTTTANGNPVTLCTIGSASAFTFTHRNGLFFGNGWCTASDTALPAGTYTVTASYHDAIGFSDYAPSSGTTPLTVNPDVTSTTLDSIGLNGHTTTALTYGSEGSAVFTATVANHTTGQTPVGSVTFTAGKTTVCTGTLAPAGGSSADAVAQCSPTSTAIPVGTYVPDTPLVATYTPANGDFTPSATPTNLGTPVLLTVYPAAVTVSPVNAKYAQVQYGNEDAEAYTAGVTSTVGTVDAGSVTFSVNGHTLCTAPVTAGSASCSPTGEDTLLAASTSPYNVTTSYSGGGSFASLAAGGATQITVVPGTTSTSLDYSTPITAGNEGSEKFLITVTDKTGLTVPTGSVTLTATGGAGKDTTVCTATLSGGQATCGLSPSELVAGGYALTVQYSGTGSFGSSTTLGTLTVEAPPTITTPVFTPTSVGTGGGVVTPLFSTQPSVVQGTPTSASVSQSASAGYTAQLSTTGNIGAVTFTTTGPSPQLKVSSTGVVTTTGTLTPGTYGVVGTLQDADGNTGVWGFQLTVTSSDVAGSQTVTKSVVLAPKVAVLSHNLVLEKAAKQVVFTRPRIQCSGATCSVTAWITQRQGHFVKRNGKEVLVSKIVVLGKVTFSLAAGKTGRPRLDLNAAGRKAIGRASRADLPLRVVLHAAAKGGNVDAKTVKVV